MGIGPLQASARVHLALEVVEAGEQFLAIGQVVLVRGVQHHVGHVRAARLEGRERRAQEAGLPRIAPRHVLGLLGQADEGRHARVDVPLQLHRHAADARPAAHRRQRLLRPAGGALIGIVSAAGRRRPTG